MKHCRAVVGKMFDCTCSYYNFRGFMRINGDKDKVFSKLSSSQERDLVLRSFSSANINRGLRILPVHLSNMKQTKASPQFLAFAVPAAP